jgi:hypothetical protein
MSDKKELYRYRAWVAGGFAMAFFCEYETIDKFWDAIQKGGTLKLKHTTTGAIPRSSNELIDIRCRAEDIKLIDNFYGETGIVIGSSADRVVTERPESVTNLGQQAQPARVINPGQPLRRK